MKPDPQQPQCGLRSLGTRILWLGILILCLAESQLAARELDFLIDTDPELNFPEPVRHFNPELKTLWLKALERPEVDMQRMAAETIARAHEAGMPDLVETVPALERVLAAEPSHLATRYAAARALIVLDSRNSSQQLFEASQRSGSDVRQLIEPALARWNFGPVVPMWLARLDSQNVRRRDLVLAIRGLAQIREPSALTPLLSLAVNLGEDADLRLEAATAVGQISDTGLEGKAERLAANDRTPHFVNQICAVKILASHTSENARRLLVGLATYQEPAVAAAALQRLNALDSSVVLHIAENVMKSPDPHVRREGARALLKFPTVERVAALAQLLNDPHPEIRRDVCDGLIAIAQQQDFAEAVHKGAMERLAADSWQGQEQAALLLGAIDYEPASARLVELLESPRDEVMVSTAWALRKIAVPQTGTALLDKARRQTEARKTGLTNDVTVSTQISLLFEALGILKAHEALPLLMEYVPKQVILGDRPRGSAIWAIGMIHEGTRKPDIEEALTDRLNDFSDQNPESLFIKEMCAIALARMNAIDLAPSLREFIPMFPNPPRFAAALRWSVRRLTGEEFPPPEAPIVEQVGWFLEPLAEADDVP